MLNICIVLKNTGPASDDIIYYFSSIRQKGAIRSNGPFKNKTIFTMNRGKDALPSNAAFLLQCPYLVNSSKLTAWDHREQEKRSSSPQKPQRKTPEMPQTFHTWQVPSSADAGGANASEPYGWFVRTSSVKIQRIKWIDNESDSHLGRFFQKDGN